MKASDRKINPGGFVLGIAAGFAKREITIRWIGSLNYPGKPAGEIRCERI
jgi:hypothetical protein